MGYFNIFYKLTRIIDFFTRKRNRKFILALCLIGGIVFFSPNVANAQYTSYDSQQLTAIRNDLDNINNGVDIHLSVLYTSVLNQEYDIDAIRTYVTSILSTLSTMNSNLTTVKNTLNSIETDVDDVETQINDLLTYANSIEIKIDTIMNTLDNIDYNIEYYGDLNHEDLEEIKELLRQYLYGDKNEFPVSYNTVTGLQFDYNNHTIIRQGNGNIDVIHMKKGYRYVLIFDSVASWDYRAFYFYRNSYIKPVEGYNIDSEGNIVDSIVIPANGNFELVINPTSDIYFYVSYLRVYITLSSVTSNYNEGQEERRLWWFNNYK